MTTENPSRPRNPWTDTPIPDDPPNPAGAELPEVRGICDVPRASAEDGTELLQHRFLCRGGGMLLVGPTGIGKSTLTMQLLISWALGRSGFDFVPVRPLRILLIQAENDDGDIAEIRDGIIAEMGLFEHDRAVLNANLKIVREDCLAGRAFVSVVDALLELHEADMVVLDPLLSYLGCDATNQEGVTEFLRSALNPVLHRRGCAALLVHHVNKPFASKNGGGMQAGDYAYAGAGSAEFANWARAIVVLRSIGRPDVFELRLAKRGSRVGWKEADGVTTRYARQIAHCKTAGRICWEDVDPEAEIVVPLNNGRRGTALNAGDVLKLVPAVGSIPQDQLVVAATRAGIGQNRAKNYIKDLVEAGTIHKIRVARPGTRPEIFYSREGSPQEG